jgi:hypothetical protein
VDFTSLLPVRIANFPYLFPARIKSNRGFFNTSKIFAERRKALLLPASFLFFPEVVLPLLPITPLALLLPLLPITPLALLLPPRTFRLELEDLAFFLKHPVQNFALREAASFLQCGLLHFLVAFVFVLAAG